MRLSAGASWRGHPTREQQVLHYQWFADLGSAEAQRALGQMLTQGVQRDPEQAFRYFRWAPALPEYKPLQCQNNPPSAAAV